MIPNKPLPPKPSELKRLSEKRARMTIAIGAHCADGLIVAADTNVILSDGSKSQAIKVQSANGPTGSYVFANAAEDGNAANTLVAHLVADVTNNQINSLAILEAIVADRMTQWASAFSLRIPSVQLIMAARIDRVSFPCSNIGGGHGLYFCEPPNTVLRKMELDDSRGYLAIGTGAAVTDPLYRMLFPGFASTPMRLMQICYLMYHAKKDSAFCGGSTNAVVLKNSGIPIWVTPLDTEEAEHFGGRMDWLFAGMAGAIMRPSGDECVSGFNDLAEIVAELARPIRDFKFRALTGLTEID